MMQIFTDTYELGDICRIEEHLKIITTLQGFNYVLQFTCVTSGLRNHNA